MTNTTTNPLTSAEQEELDTLEAAFDFLGGRGIEIAERIDELRLKRAKRPIVDVDAAKKALDFVMEYGIMLDAKEEWDLDDNLTTTEMLYDLYQKITGQR